MTKAAKSASTLAADTSTDVGTDTGTTDTGTADTASLDVDSLIADAIANYEAVTLPGLLQSAGEAAVSVYQAVTLPGLLANAGSDAVSQYVSNTLPGLLQQARDAAVAEYLTSHPFPDLPGFVVDSEHEAEQVEALPLDEALALVERVVTIPPKAKGDEPTTEFKPISEHEVFAYKDLGDRVVFVTIDGQKFYGDKA